MEEEKKEVSTEEVKDVVGAPLDTIAPSEPVVDLETLRDEKVIPVARGVLTDMASEVSAADINKNTDLTSIVIKILKRGLAADLNVTTENPYVFQLVLGAYGALNTVIINSKMREIDDVRFGKIGGEILTILANGNIPMGTKVTKVEQEAAAELLKGQIEEIFARENLTWLEVKYITEGLFRSLKSIEQVYTSNIDLSVKRMECKILGIDDFTDLSMAKLDETLQKDMSEVKSEA